MAQLLSSEGSAQSVASGIVTAASSVGSGGQAVTDEVSSYPGNDTAKEKIAEEGSYASTISTTLNSFVTLIQTTAAEFVGMDNHIAREIQTPASRPVLPATGAVLDPDFVPDPTLFAE